VRVFPVLKPASWQALTYGARAHVWIGTPQAPEVVVAYGCWDGGFVSYITNETPAYNDPDVLVREAFDNLKAHEGELQVVGTGADRVVISAGPFAAEQVLSERHVLAIHDRLEAAEIVVSIPRRDALLACPADASEQLRRTVTGLHREAWEGRSQPGDQVLDDKVFDGLLVFSAGLKTDVLPLGERAATAVGAPSRWGAWSVVQ